MKLSIIVPIYNVEPYLRRCIDSILAQTFTDFELILVDDGSPDNCPTICDEYAKIDSRIVVIHKENGGVSSARNAGLQIAKGDKVVFCDSDDEMPYMALELLYNNSRKTNAQFVVGGIKYIKINIENNTISYLQTYQRNEINITTDDSTLFQFWINNNMLSACGKIFDRMVIEENNLSFDQNLVVMEDYSFVIDYLSNCTNISMIKDIVYHYYQSSVPVIIRRSRRDFFFDIIHVSEKLQEFLLHKNSEHIEDYQKETIYPTLRMSYDVLWSIEASGLAQRKEKYKKIIKAIRTEQFQNMLQKYKKDFSRIDYLCLKNKCFFGILIKNCLRRICNVLFHNDK